MNASAAAAPHQPHAALPEQDGAHLQLSVPADLPARLLGAVPLRKRAAGAAHGRVADGQRARRRLLRPADHDGERARARRLAAYRLTPVSTRGAGREHGRGALRASSSPRASCSSPLAMAIGMPLPKHPFDLFIVFTFVSFAFIGLGLVMAMLADNVPAVQALGQCIFLPMLIIGGIAVPLASLPDWAQHVSAFFPGRYAVEALPGVRRSATAWARRGSSCWRCVIIGAGGCVAGAKMFRWDAQQRFAARSGKAWVSVALLSWASSARCRNIAAASATRPAPRPPSTTADVPGDTPPLRPPQHRRSRSSAPEAPPHHAGHTERGGKKRRAERTRRRNLPAATPAPAPPQPAPPAKPTPAAESNADIGGGHAGRHRSRSHLRSAAVRRRDRHANCSC